jgi:hypothetical protein
MDQAYVVFISQWGGKEFVKIFASEDGAKSYVDDMENKGYRGYFYEAQAVN